MLKKYDVIKLGRVKFKVKDIQIGSVTEARSKKKELLKRREEKWKKREVERIKETMQKIKSKPHHSARV